MAQYIPLIFQTPNSGIWSPHGDQPPTIHYSASDLLNSLAHGVLPHNAKRHKDGRLEIPIKLDAHISIPQFQKEFGDLFKNYTPVISFHQSTEQAHHKPHDRKTNQPDNGYLVPAKNLKDVHKVALLGNVPATQYGPPKPPTNYQPPTSLYTLPKQQVLTEKTYNAPGVGTLYSLPHEAAKEYKASYRAPGASYQAPEPAYQAPEPAYQAPEPTYQAPEPSYKAPEPAYQAPEPAYQAPKLVYEEPKSSYKPPTSLYTPPKQDSTYKKHETLYETPKSQSKEHSLFEALQSYQPPSKLYGVPEKIDLLNIYSPPKAPKKISAEIYEITLGENKSQSAGYNYKPPDGYTADSNPTFPKKLYEAPKNTKEGYQPPDGYDYSPPKGYKASDNPTFPKDSYKGPNISNDYAKGLDYPAPDGYDPAHNPTFPKKLYQAPTKKPINYKPLKINHKAPKKIDPAGYNPPSGYDYPRPHGYDPSHNPTFPQSLYETPKKVLSSSYDPPSVTGYKAPDGYDYRTPNGYDPSTNPTFPEDKTEYKGDHGYAYAPPPTYDPAENPTFPKSFQKPKKPQLDTGYSPPGAQEDDGYEKQSEKGAKLPLQYDYRPPHGYDALENPTFPKKESYHPTEGYNYQAPPGHDPAYNPTFPKPSTLYDTPQNGYPKHSFNIIIKNKDKPPTELRIASDGYPSSSLLQKKSGEPVPSPSSNLHQVNTPT